MVFLVKVIVNEKNKKSFEFFLLRCKFFIRKIFKELIEK